MRIWHILIPESRAPSSGLTYELAYEARVAIDALRFAIKLDHELTPETRQSTALVLLDALNCLAGAERHFRIERVPLHGSTARRERTHRDQGHFMKHNSWFARADSSPALESRMMRLDRQGWQGDLMRAVAFQSPVDSQPPGALDQLFYSDRLLTAKEVARVLSNQRKEGLQLRIEGSDALLQDSILGPFSGEGSEPLVEPARIRAPIRTHSIIKAFNLFFPLRQVSICV